MAPFTPRGHRTATFALTLLGSWGSAPTPSRQPPFSILSLMAAMADSGCLGQLPLLIRLGTFSFLQAMELLKPLLPPRVFLPTGIAGTAASRSRQAAVSLS